MVAPLAAGALDQLVTIQRRASGADAHGQESTTWQTHAANVWAQVRAVPGRDLLAAGQPQATFDLTVRMRYRTDITPDMRIMWGSTPLEIVGQPVDPDGGRHITELRCLSGLRGGAA